MLLSMLMLAAVQDPDAVEDALAQYRERTRGDVACRRSADPDEIVVCAARDADRYRVPFVLSGSARDSIPLQTERLTRDYAAVECGQGAFIVNCGSVGVSVTVGATGIRWNRRELAK